MIGMTGRRSKKRHPEWYECEIQLLLNKGMAKFAAQRKLLKHRASRSGFRARKCSRIERKRAWGWGVWEEGSWEIGSRENWGGEDARRLLGVGFLCWVGGGGRRVRGYADTYWPDCLTD